MLPERLSWITEAFEPEGDPWVFLQIARDLESEGNLAGAATVYDRAYGLAPEIDKVRAARQAALDRLAITEHGLTFRYVPGGPFLMGCRDGEQDEQPLHPIWLSPYWLSDTPVTWADYCRILEWQAPPMGVPTQADADLFLVREENKVRRQYSGTRVGEEDGPQSRRGPRGVSAGDPPEWRYDLKPMVSVGWQQAEDLCSRLSTWSVRYSLPTEAQWEKAARGGLIGARYGWGDEPPSEDNCDFDNFHAFVIRPMRQLPPNGYGLYSMNGGVWEWVADWYDRAYYRESPSHDPRGPDGGEEKVLRGGSWADCAATVTNTFRSSRPSKHWRNWRHAAGGWGGHVTPNVGFRVCRTVAKT